MLSPTEKRRDEYAEAVGLAYEDVADLIAFGSNGVKKASGKLYFQNFTAQQRAPWLGYAHPRLRKPDHYYVSCTMEREAVVRCRASRRAVAECSRSVAYLHHYKRPMVPDFEFYAAMEAPDTLGDATFLSIDTEGRDKIFRYSVAWQDNGLWYAGSLPWDGPGKSLLRTLLSQAPATVFWHAPHDVALLEADGFKLDPSTTVDAMVAHQILNPWQRRALGWAAPLYGCFTPWKHLWNVDQELYSMKDAFVPGVAWARMRDELVSTRQWDLLTNELALARLLNFSAKPRWESDETWVTKAAGLLEGEV